MLNILQSFSHTVGNTAKKQIYDVYSRISPINSYLSYPLKILYNYQETF